MPSFVAWQRKYGQRGLQVIGISMDDDPALVRQAYRKLKLNYPVAMGDVKLGDLYGGVLGLPITFLIDRHGVIRAEFQGETEPEQNRDADATALVWSLNAAASWFVMCCDSPVKCDHLPAQRLHQMRPVAQMRMPCLSQGIVASSGTLPVLPS